jgi:hypothetical protein
MDKRITPFVMARKKTGRGLATQIAVNALLIYEELSGRILVPFVCFVGHGSAKKRRITLTVKTQAGSKPVNFTLKTPANFPLSRKTGVPA